jgi:hypothetical protein
MYMTIDFTTWGPLTVLTVAVILLVVAGGLVVVITGGMSYETFIERLTVLAGLLGGGTAVGRGIQLAGKSR